MSNDLHTVVRQALEELSDGSKWIRLTSLVSRVEELRNASDDGAVNAALWWMEKQGEPLEFYTGPNGGLVAVRRGEV